MASVLDRRLAAFVDRNAEVNRFCSAIDADAIPALVVWGASGRGKSTLLARMQQECRMRDINELRFIWKPPRVFDYQMIMSRVAERSDGNCFDEYFRKLDDYRNAENRFLLGFGNIRRAVVNPPCSRVCSRNAVCAT